MLFIHTSNNRRCPSSDARSLISAGHSFRKVLYEHQSYEHKYGSITIMTDFDLLLLWSFPLGLRFEFLPSMNTRVHHLGILDTRVELPIWSPPQCCIDSPWIPFVQLDKVFALILNYFFLQFFKRSERGTCKNTFLVWFQIGSHFRGLLRGYVTRRGTALVHVGTGMALHYTRLHMAPHVINRTNSRILKTSGTGRIATV